MSGVRIDFLPTDGWIGDWRFRMLKSKNEILSYWYGQFILSHSGQYFTQLALPHYFYVIAQIFNRIKLKALHGFLIGWLESQFLVIYQFESFLDKFIQISRFKNDWKNSELFLSWISCFKHVFWPIVTNTTSKLSII